MPKRTLKTAGDVRRYLANVITRLEKDEIDGQKAGKIGFLVNILLRSIEAEDHEARIVELEEALEEFSKRGKP